MGKLMYSFIVPVYNCEQYLEECISSIQMQGLRDNYEIILVDDGSLDGSSQICDNYDKKFEYIHVFHKKNGGASSARNYGIEQAKGEYLLFVDGDDTLDRELMAELHKNNIEKESLVIYGMSFDYYDKDKITRTEELFYPKHGYIDERQLGNEFEQLFVCNSLSSVCNKMFSRKLINRNHLRFDEGMDLYEDFEFVLRYLKYAKNLFCIKKGYYHYRLQINVSRMADGRISDFDRLKYNLNKIDIGIKELEKGLILHETGRKIYFDLYTQLMYHYMVYADNVPCAVKKVFIETKEKNCISDSCNCEQNKILQYSIRDNSIWLLIWVYKKLLRIKIKKIVKPWIDCMKKILIN